MALDFTGIRDEPGSAVYFMHDGSSLGEAAMQALMDEVKQSTQKQCSMLDISGPVGRKLVDFYDLRGTHMVIIIGDDDHLHKVWSDGERFDPKQIAFVVNQIG